MQPGIIIDPAKTGRRRSASDLVPFDPNRAERQHPSRSAEGGRRSPGPRESLLAVVAKVKLHRIFQEFSQEESILSFIVKNMFMDSRVVKMKKLVVVGVELMYLFSTPDKFRPGQQSHRTTAQEERTHQRMSSSNMRN